MRNWILQGNCINSFDEDGASMLPFFSDVSDFACVEESAQDVVLDAGTKAEIQASLSGVECELEFSFSEERNLLIGYDSTSDTHYFFVQEEAQRERQLG